MLEEQYIGVPLLEGVHTLKEALGLERAVTVDGAECHVLLPVRGQVRSFLPLLAGPPIPGGHNAETPSWPKGMERAWGEYRRGDFAIVQAVGIIPAGTMIRPGDEHIDFDYAVALWRQRLQDWLAVAAGGPTDFPDRDYYGATIFGSSAYDDEMTPYQPLEFGLRHRPCPLGRWAWTHALDHASNGDEPPLARSLMTSAIRAATAANWRVAIIDAATAVEIALTAGLRDRLAGETSPSIAKALLDKYRMLGNLIDLSRRLDVSVPARLMEDLVARRNAIAHQGVSPTKPEAKAAIKVAWEVVREHGSLLACCRESGDSLGAEDAE